MKIASIVLISTFFYPAYSIGQEPQPDPTQTDVGAGVPKEYTPTYNCVVGFVRAIAHRHLLGGHFHMTLDLLGIPHDSPVKDALIQFTLRVIDLRDKPYRVPFTEETRQEWVDGQYAWMENRVRLTKQHYDELLDAVEAAGWDSDNVHKTIVEEGRKVTSITLFGDTEWDAKQRDIFRIFEPETKNPWLQKVED